MSGRIAYGIITDGLDGYYLASNTKSYPESGSIWKNLISTTVNTDITLIGSPTFDSASVNKNITFVSQSSQQRFTVPYYTLTTEPFAVDIWYTFSTSSAEYTENYTTILSAAANMLDGFSAASGRTGWTIMGYGNNIYAGIRYDDGTSPGSQITLQSFVTGSTYNIFLHRNTTTQKIQVYINGSLRLDSSVSNSKSFGGLNSNPLQHRSWLYGPTYAVGKYHSIKLHRNRNFTQSEIVSNYLAQKDKFSI
jgi:hypothetical protein